MSITIDKSGAIIKATIPSEAVAAEAARQLIRDKYSVMQTEINAAGDVGTLKSIVEGL